MSSTRCRICTKPNAAVYLFHQDEEINYGSKLKKCTGVEISQHDFLPHSICVDCLSELEITYEFILKCRSSDARLRAELDSDNIANTPFSTATSPRPAEDVDHVINDEVDFIDTEDAPDVIDEDKVLAEALKSNSSKWDTSTRKKLSKVKKKEKSAPKSCVTCGHTTNSQSALIIHERKHTGEKPFECDSCDFKFTTNGLLKRHIEVIHTKRERRFICETCSSSFYSKSDLATHLRMHTKEKPYICQYCNKRFSQTSSLIRHRRTHTGEKPYVCVICQKPFSDKSSLNKHNLTHNKDRKIIICQLCNKPLKSLDSLKVHLSALHHNERLNVCNYCGAAFNLKGNLTSHIRRLHSEKSGVCKVCSKSFSDLAAHMRRHTGEKPYACEFCDKQFLLRGGLTHHILFKHKNANKFRCSFEKCLESFPMGSMLEFHILKSHTNQTPYVCHHCSRGFFRPSDLSRHLKGSHMELTNSNSATTPMPMKREVC